MLDSLSNSKTCLRLLVKFFISVVNAGNLRGLASGFNESTNAVRKELNNLVGASYFGKENVQNRIQYKANSKQPLFGLLLGIVRKCLGLGTIVEQVHGRMGDVVQIVLTGNYANGFDSGTIEAPIIGRSLYVTYPKNLELKIKDVIKRKIHFTIFNPQDRPFSEAGLIVFSNTN